MRGFCSRARSAPQQNEDFWERSGPTEGGGSTPAVCGHVHMCACAHHPKGGFTSRGAKRRVRFEKKSRIRRVHSHAHAHKCACRRVHTCAHKCFMPEKHARPPCTRAPEGAPRPKRSEVTKNITARSHLRTHVIVSKSCERRVRHACICTRRVHIRTFGAVYEPRSEAESALRKEKETEP